MDTIEERAQRFADEHMVRDNSDPHLRDVIYLTYIAAAIAERNLVFSRLTELFQKISLFQKCRKAERKRVENSLKFIKILSKL